MRRTWASDGWQWNCWLGVLFWMPTLCDPFYLTLWTVHLRARDNGRRRPGELERQFGGLNGLLLGQTWDGCLILRAERASVWRWVHLHNLISVWRLVPPHVVKMLDGGSLSILSSNSSIHTLLDGGFLSITWVCMHPSSCRLRPAILKFVPYCQD